MNPVRSPRAVAAALACSAASAFAGVHYTAHVVASPNDGIGLNGYSASGVALGALERSPGPLVTRSIAIQDGAGRCDVRPARHDVAP